MPSVEELLPLLTEPREALDREYKDWLNLREDKHRALLVKAAIALANHGGGYIIIGFKEQVSRLVASNRPDTVPETKQDDVNNAVRHFATPDFHCETYHVQHPETGTVHPIVVVPGDMTVPVMSKRECAGVIGQNRCYIRRLGPSSEEPQTVEEWRSLLRRCLLAGREEMLEAIRAIVLGRVESVAPTQDPAADLHAFVEAGRARWEELTLDMPAEAPARFPLGYYELGFSLIGAKSAPSLSDLQDRLAVARRIQLTGWSTFLSMTTPGWAPYPHEDFVEAWIGRPIRDDWMSREPSHNDFWRVSLEGKLYTIRGYKEDGHADRVKPGSIIDVSLPVWRVGEGVLFAARLAATFEDVEAIAIECRFTGLHNRTLECLDHNWAVFGDDVSKTDNVTLKGFATPAQIQDNLPEIIHPLLVRLYERFNFFRLPFEVVVTELGRLKRGHP